MKKPEIFAIRFFLSVVFAFLVSRFFFEKIAVTKIIGLALIMLGLAYLFEYIRKRDKGEINKN
jgi:uncharacterized membrane protein